jgi:rhodanese-related sulfurtransferase
MRLSTNRVLAAFAGVLAVGALVAGDVRRIEPDQVSAVDVATWIRDRDPNLRIIDLRDSASFEFFHIPTAERIPAAAIAKASFPRDAKIVLYDVDALPLDAWSALKQRGAQVYVLTDGLGAWVNDIMNPRLPPDATSTQRQEYERKKELAEYFGGQASVYSEPGAVSPSTLQSLQRLKRRTC